MKLARLAARQILVPERDAEAQDGEAGIVYVLVELLGPQPHAGAPGGIGRTQRDAGKALVEILVDDVRLRNHDLVVHQGRDDGAAVELEIPVLLMLPAAQVEVPGDDKTVARVVSPTADDGDRAAAPER